MERPNDQFQRQDRPRNGHSENEIRPLNLPPRGQYQDMGRKNQHPAGQDSSYGNEQLASNISSKYPKLVKSNQNSAGQIITQQKVQEPQNNGKEPEHQAYIAHAPPHVHNAQIRDQQPRPQKNRKAPKPPHKENDVSSNRISRDDKMLVGEDDMSYIPSRPPPLIPKNTNKPPPRPEPATHNTNTHLQTPHPHQIPNNQTLLPTSNLTSHSYLPHYRDSAHDLTRRILPTLFLLLFTIFLTAALIYSLNLHAPIPASLVTGIGIAFAVLVGLWLGIVGLVYVKTRKREGREIRERNERISRGGLGRGAVGGWDERGREEEVGGGGRGENGGRRRKVKRGEEEKFWGAGRFYGSIRKIKEVVWGWLKGGDVQEVVEGRLQRQPVVDLDEWYVGRPDAGPDLPATDFSTLFKKIPRGEILPQIPPPAVPKAVYIATRRRSFDKASEGKKVSKKTFGEHGWNSSKKPEIGMSSGNGNIQHTQTTEFEHQQQPELGDVIRVPCLSHHNPILKRNQTFRKLRPANIDTFQSRGYINPETYRDETLSEISAKFHAPASPNVFLKVGGTTPGKYQTGTISIYEDGDGDEDEESEGNMKSAWSSDSSDIDSPQPTPLSPPSPPRPSTSNLPSPSISPNPNPRLPVQPITSTSVPTHKSSLKRTQTIPRSGFGSKHFQAIQSTSERETNVNVNIHQTRPCDVKLSLSGDEDDDDDDVGNWNGEGKGKGKEVGVCDRKEEARFSYSGDEDFTVSEPKGDVRHQVSPQLPGSATLGVFVGGGYVKGDGERDKDRDREVVRGRKRGGLGDTGPDERMRHVHVQRNRGRADSGTLPSPTPPPSYKFHAEDEDGDRGGLLDVEDGSALTRMHSGELKDGRITQAERRGREALRLSDDEKVRTVIWDVDKKVSDVGSVVVDVESEARPELRMERRKRGDEGFWVQRWSK